MLAERPVVASFTVPNLFPLIRRCLSKKCTDPTDIILRDQCYVARTHDPLPVVAVRGYGSQVWDVKGKRYIDCIGGAACVPTGHCHPAVVEALTEQASILGLTSREVYSNALPLFAEYASKIFRFPKVLPMTTGNEAVETAVKIARKWAYQKKRLGCDKAKIIFTEGTIWGASLTAASSATDPIVFHDYGPFLPGFGLVPFNDICALKDVFCDPNVCAFVMEPVLAERGCITPIDRYLRQVRELCTQHQILWIADECITGLGRTGAFFACDHDCVQPDIVVVGTGLGGGLIPISCVAASECVMNVITPRTHPSTYAGNPLACRVAIATLGVIGQESLIKNACEMGEKFRKLLTCCLPKEKVPYITGKGLLNGITINPEYGCAKDITQKLACGGLLAKPCGCNSIRFTPPLNICCSEIQESVQIICDTFKDLQKVDVCC